MWRASVIQTAAPNGKSKGASDDASSADLSWAELRAVCLTCVSIGNSRAVSRPNPEDGNVLSPEAIPAELQSLATTCKPQLVRKPRLTDLFAVECVLSGPALIPDEDVPIR